MPEEEVTCTGPCGRTFNLITELQKKKGESEKGWLCPICRFNKKNEGILGFVERKL